MLNRFMYYNPLKFYPFYMQSQLTWKYNVFKKVNLGCAEQGLFNIHAHLLSGGRGLNFDQSPLPV